MGDKELNKKAIKELDKIYLNKIGVDKKFRKKVMKVIDDAESLSKPDTSVIPVPGTPCNRLTSAGFKLCSMDIFERLGIDFGHGVVPFQYSYNILRGKIDLDLDYDEHVCNHHVILTNYQMTISWLYCHKSKISIADDIYNGCYVNILRFLSTSILADCTDIKLRMRDIKVDNQTADMIDLLRWDLFNIYFLYTDGWFDVEGLQKYAIPIMNRLTFLGIFFTDHMSYEKYARYVPGCAGIRAFNIKDPDSPRCLEVTNSGDSYSYQRGYIDKASVDTINEKVRDKIVVCYTSSHHSGTDAKMTDIIADVNKMNQTIPDSLLPQMYSLGVTRVKVSDDGEYSFFNEKNCSDTIPWLHDMVYSMILEIIDEGLVSTKSKDAANVAAILSI